MRRRLFNFAAAVSLVLCLISLEWWRTSYGMPRTARLNGVDQSVLCPSLGVGHPGA